MEEPETDAARWDEAELLSCLPSILILIDSQMRVRRWNAIAEQTFHLPAERALGHALLEVTPHWDWETLQQQFEACDHAGASVPGAVWLRNPGEAERVFATTVRACPHGAYLVVSSDITEMSARTVQDTKLESIGRLAAGVAHELNTPIQYVGHNLTFLRESFDDLRRVFDVGVAMQADGADLEAARHALAQAMEEADLVYLLTEIPQALAQGLEGIERVGRIVAAMKEFSHPGSREKSFLDLNHLLLSTLTLSRNEWKYVAEVVTDLDPTLPTVECLGAEISQVFLNLVLNAAHAIADATRQGEAGKGTLTVATRCDGDQAEVRITDTGTGIPRACRDKIFEPFFTTKAVGRGTGQGLAIARSVIVQRHRGALDFETEEGRGTTFVIRLPLRAQSPVGIG